jgi:predicted transcriptional regulator
MNEPNPSPSRLTFDPTINAGHLLTFAGFLVTGFVAYATLDKRITVVEQRTVAAEVRISEQDSRTNSTLAEIKRDVRDTSITVNQLARELSKGKP